jgi:uncharacterized tellurite resistance protein B-like protein
MLGTPVALLLLLVLMTALPLTLFGVVVASALRWWRGRALAVWEVAASPREVRAGDRIAVRARAAARSGREIEVTATLTCTLFDHRARRLFGKRVLLRGDLGVGEAPARGPSASGAQAPGGATARSAPERVGEVVVPRAALRTGSVGDELSTLFSEEARRLLCFWTVVFEARIPGERRALARKALPIEVCQGRALATDEGFMSELVVDTFAQLKDDLVFNWLVKMAAHDGQIAASERIFLHALLAGAHGIVDPGEADRRIAVEQERTFELDPELMRRHVPIAQRVDFYKLLYAVAWKDGNLDAQEHAFLIATLRDFGLDPHHVREVELEVLRGIAGKTLS